MIEQATNPPRDAVLDTPEASAVDAPADGAVPDPRTGRQPGLLQVAVLMLSSCLSILGAALIAPVLPNMQAAFGDVAGAAALVPLVLTAPALVVAACSRRSPVASSTPWAARTSWSGRCSSTPSSAPRPCGWTRCR